MIKWDVTREDAKEGIMTEKERAQKEAMRYRRQKTRKGIVFERVEA